MGWRLPHKVIFLMTKTQKGAFTIERERAIEVELTETVEKVKAKIENQHGVAMDQHCLIFEDQQLEDDRTLQHYNIQKGSRLYLGDADNTFGHTKATANPLANLSAKEDGMEMKET